MHRRRVLVVDDLPDVCATLSGDLSDEGHDVRSASSRAEALQVLEAERFHVAVLDVRLDESDESNREGLLLMHEIGQKYPTVAIIVLTGYADVEMVQEALQPDLNGKSPAFDFLQKSQVERLPEYVERAFESFVRIDSSLEIEDTEQFLPQIFKQLRFTSASKPSRKQLTEEADELLRKLFFGRTSIQLKPIRRGYSGVAICEVTPWYRGRGRGETLIAKIGEEALIEQEIDKYENLVQGTIGGHRLPNMLKTARTWSLAGVVYTYAGLGSPKDFTTFFFSSDISRIRSALRNLFRETCFPSRKDSGYVHHNLDLGQVYRQLLRLYPQKLSVCLDNTMGGRHPFHRDDDKSYIWLGNQFRLLNPVTFALSSDLRTDSYTCIIHGDLHGYNVLVDRHNETWLIDFANTCQGPLLQDYASFETYLRLSVVQCGDWHLLYAWDRASFDVPDLCAATLPQDLADIPEIAKAHQSILTVRELALQDSKGNAERAYLIGLMFTALKVMTIMELSPAQRDHALMTAALIAVRLHKGL